jgi:hypothetical protein
MMNAPGDPCEVPAVRETIRAQLLELRATFRLGDRLGLELPEGYEAPLREAEL